MKLIETKTLTTAAAEIGFTSIPQDGTDLLMLCSLRMSRATTGGTTNIKLNGSTANFSRRRLVGSGSSASSQSSSDNVGILFTDGGNQTANTFGNHAIYFPNYTGSTNKSFSVDSVDENNATESYQVLTAGLWSNTAAITSIALYDEGASNWVVGSTISLYKITKGSDGIVTVS
jgi:hypothetical protein